MCKSAWMFVVIIVACLATTISAAPFLMTPAVPITPTGPFFSGRTYLPGEEAKLDFVVKNKDGKVTVTPNVDNRRKARLRDGKCLIFTTDFEYFCEF